VRIGLRRVRGGKERALRVGVRLGRGLRVRVRVVRGLRDRVRLGKVRKRPRRARKSNTAPLIIKQASYRFRPVLQV
jgi:hypothetical protein